LNFIFFQDWGKPGDIHNLGINWHIPNEAEISAAQKLIDEFLFDELNNLSEFSKGTILLNRDQLLNRLNVVSNILYGCGSILPFWKSAKKFDDDFCPKSLVDSVTDLTPLEFSTTTRPLELTLGGKNVRQEIAKVAFKLQVRSNIQHNFLARYFLKTSNTQKYFLQVIKNIGS
jgi:proteasome activator subunit 4